MIGQNKRSRYESPSSHEAQERDICHLFSIYRLASVGTGVSALDVVFASADFTRHGLSLEATPLSYLLEAWPSKEMRCGCFSPYLQRRIGRLRILQQGISVQ